jgi:hypothetical protein
MFLIVRGAFYEKASAIFSDFVRNLQKVIIPYGNRVDRRRYAPNDTG